METVAVIDYGMGNLHSVAKALEHVGAGRVLITSDANVIREADRVVFPGVGAIRDCMAEIRRLGFDSLVREVSQDRPFLGICVGMQALLDGICPPMRSSTSTAMRSARPQALNTVSIWW